MTTNENPAAVRVCAIADIQCSRGCGTGACKREAESLQPTAAPADLQGLRRSILTSREIVRDQDGMLSHPAVPYLDEDVNYETFFAAFGIEATFIHMEDDVDCDTYDRYFASNSPDCCTWTPSSPQGDGWMLLEIYDTEDGPVALYVREKKPESMRERWKREKRESDAAAPSPADARMEFVERVMGMFEAWPKGEPGPTDEPESHYRFGYNTALEDVLTALDVGSPTRRAASANETGAEVAQQLSAEIAELKIKLVSYEREREDQTRYLAAQSEEIAALKYQLAQADARVGLTDSDVFTLIGHAELLRGRGETDMPAWCLGLAHRIAFGIDKALAARVAEIRVKFELPPITDCYEVDHGTHVEWRPIHKEPEPRAEVTSAARDVLAERRRQVEQEGWTPEHDDAHSTGDMALAAACYAAADNANYPPAEPPDLWPWDSDWWKPSDERRNLVKAGALIIAEIERLDRRPDCVRAADEACADVQKLVDGIDAARTGASS
ncbi:gp41 [Burkholderia pseudomallei]|uniref:hypothetical protein n=1 Tax=Burkholderia pseudomallei TaxID=28450 RepID=UPI0005DF1240|nr:hypothetical protein [Burkholderia pseudomallei]CFK42777.1 gp41 [Burkholderia pseudomallei]CFL21811.1 gp41 [Burkholderia pseudomallei]CPF08454.1 gp41 [Burkholderia pseudomallei]CPG75497.1 gp41 [Burkholderia pseudomallei]